MRLTRPRPLWPTLLSAAVLVASGCASITQTSTDAAQRTPEAPTAEETTAIPALAGDVVVSTNEPFWQARIVGNTLRLSGVDGAERRLTVVSSSERSGRRIVRATDTAGSVVATIDDLRCQDSMSGKTFPLAGTLTVDDAGLFPGCARPGRIDGDQP